MSFSGGALAVGLAPLALPAVGFTAAGVAAGSLAAGVQSALYAGATTGAFSVLQSAGKSFIQINGLICGDEISALSFFVHTLQFLCKISCNSRILNLFDSPKFDIIFTVTV